MKILALLTVLFSCSFTFSFSSTLEVGQGKQFATLQVALDSALPGDSIVMFAGVYTGGTFKADLHGLPDKWTVIRAADSEEVIIRGGTSAMQLSDARYLVIEGLTFDAQTGNGINLDDGGTIETPAHHIIIQYCTWLSMNAIGNNDELKMSGVDTFYVRFCNFLNGSQGGSCIDMVGCHVGNFNNNYFDNAGSNCIQAKGGTSNIFIQRNLFLRGGERALNIGGSTGLQFFRPLGALYEAKSIYVFSNVFNGSTAPIAFVGAIDCEVINNTFINPTRWVVRILQETTEPGFLPCGNNKFINNVVVMPTTGQPAINIGGNTAPETFEFSHNIWYNPDNPLWVPNTPTVEINAKLVNPQLTDSLGNITSISPASRGGANVNNPMHDFSFTPFNKLDHPIGAHNWTIGLTVSEVLPSPSISPNPAVSSINIHSNSYIGEITINNVNGQTFWNGTVEYSKTISIDNLTNGFYIIRKASGEFIGTFIKLR